MNHKQPRRGKPNYKPPLSYKVLTPLYDLVIAALTRERVWRKAFIHEISPQTSDHILDIGSGTGSLALALHKAAPGIRYVGVDPDEDAVRRARKKTAKLKSSIRFEVAFFSASQAYFDEPPRKIVTSLVLHQVPVTEKQRIIQEVFQLLPVGGAIYIADYGRQSSWLMRLLFRLTVQLLDGVEDTQPNADGIIPVLLEQSGFRHVGEPDRIASATGVISIYAGEKLEQAEEGS
ncbi:class I SAM-dependent methyltransferase [Marinicaulis aureus]|uniref:Class I SAM-dependent methyltransferase n=1 Tax=Hyphococcus aureus TaxID=2666033 RepID=A0ABW1L2T5_9PROT